jgi:predicted PurR-regulated permease PerM
MGSRGSEKATWRFPATLLTAGIVVYLLRYVLIPFALAFVMAYVFNPVVDRLERHLHLPRIICVLLLFLVFTIPFTLLVYRNEPVLAQNFRQLAGNAPEHLTWFITNLFGGRKFSFLGREFDANIVAQQLLERTRLFPDSPLGVAQAAWVMVNVISYAILTVVVFVYFLAGGKGLIDGALSLVPSDNHGNIRRFIFRIDSLIGRYLRGLAIVVVFATAVVWLAFRLVFHIPYAPFFAITVGLLELIPLFGPIASGVMTSLTALTHGGLLFTLKVIIFYLSLRFSIDQVIGPIVLGNAVTISPVVVIFAFLAGGALFGFFGLLFAVPAAAIFKIVLEERNAA